jgi:hypothetical protein
LTAAGSRTGVGPVLKPNWLQPAKQSAAMGKSNPKK